jgi:putative nucleotidyltransferase with HDIG domain/PAS domain S-box-containing protein
MPPAPGPPDLTPQQLRAVLDSVGGALAVADPHGSRNAAVGAPGWVDRYRVAFHASAAPCLIAGLDDGIVVDANHELDAMVGATPGGTIGRSLVEIGLLPGHDAPLGALDELAGGRLVELADRGPQASPGRRRSVSVSARPIEVEGWRCAIFAFVDVTAERDAQEALRALTRFGAALETRHGFDELVREGLDNLLVQLGMDFGTCQEITPRGTRFHSFQGDAPARVRERMREPLPPGVGTMGHVARTGQPQLVSDHRTFAHAVPEALAVGIVTTLTLPVKVADETRFVLTLGSLDRRVEVGATATETALAYVRRLEHALGRVAHLQELEGTREATFRALGLALEQRELEPAGHMGRVAASCLAFARQVGLGEAQTQALTWGAYLHDVGKIALPDTILLKPGRLTGVEVELKRRHTLVGVEMLRDVPFLPTGTRQVVRSHHERWDGRGYPDGLAGPEIPLLARMFSLVDTYDALTSPRTYRPAWSVDGAVQLIGREAGSQFDPGLVRAFLGSLPAPAEATVDGP